MSRKTSQFCSHHGIKEDLFDLDSLRSCPVRVTLHTTPMIEKMCSEVRKDVSQLPMIDVARVESERERFVIVDGHARVFALKRLGINKAFARIHIVRDMAEAVSLHVRMNLRSAVNPLKYYDLYEFLCKHGLDQTEIAKRLLFGELQTRLLRVRLFDSTRTTLEKYLSQLASRYSLVHVPPYVIETLGRIRDEKMQEKAVKMMIQMIPENVSEIKFSFPSFDQLEIAFSTLRKGEPGHSKPLVFSTNLQEKRENPSVKKSDEIEEARELIGEVPNRALLKCPHGTKFLVDLKDHTISEVKEDDKIISVEGDASEPILMIPPRHARNLGLDLGDKVYFKYVSTSRQLQQFVERMKDKRQKFLIMSGTKI